MLEMITKWIENNPLAPTAEEKEHFDQVFEKLKKKYHENMPDAWGLDLEKTRNNIEYIWPVYKKYFKVRVFGQENVEDRPYMVTSNHTGQIAIDGLLIATAFATEVDQPRILRPMVERFFSTIPFLGSWAASGGAVLGDRQNCLNLLRKEQSILVFPEGVPGITKCTSEFYNLQKFTRGFFRMAIMTKTPILPIAVIGAEECFPYVHQARKLAKRLKVPAIPLSLNYFPLPSPIDIHIGKAYEIPEDLTQDATDAEVDAHIELIKEEIRILIDNGLKTRREFWANQK